MLMSALLRLAVAIVAQRARPGGNIQLETWREFGHVLVRRDRPNRPLPKSQSQQPGSIKL